MLETPGLTWEFYRDKRGEHRWRARCAKNGKILFISSEGYKRAFDARACAFRAGWKPPVQKPRAT